MRTLTLALSLALGHASSVHALGENRATLAGSGLAVAVTMSDLDGTALDRAPVGTPFTVRIAFGDNGLGAPGLNPLAWLRRVGAGASSCQDAARAARVTGRVGARDVALAGLSVVTVDAADRIAVVDPHRPASSRIVAGIVEIGERPGGFVVHPQRGEFLFTRPDKGEIVSVPLPFGRAMIFASGIQRPGQLLAGPAGRVWVEAGERVLLLDKTGATLRSEVLSRQARLLEAGARRVLAVGEAGEARLLDRGTGVPLADFPPGSVSHTVVAGENFVLTEQGGGLVRLWADSPERPESLAVPGRVLAMRVAPNGRWAIASTELSTGSVELGIVDLTLGRRVHTFSAPESFDEAILTDGAIFLTWASRPIVTVVDLAALPKGDAAVRDVRLTEGRSITTRRGPMMVSLSPLSAVAVVTPGGRTLHTVLAGGGLTSAPSQVVELKGDPPVAIAAFPRSLVARGSGRYEGSALLPEGGRWELVTTTGVGGTTACLPIPVEPSAEPPPTPSIEAELMTRQNDTVSLRIRLHGWREAPRGALRLRAAAIDGSHVEDIEATSSDVGYRTVAFRVRPTLYAISVAGSPDFSPDPAIIDLSAMAGDRP